MTHILRGLTCVQTVQINSNYGELVAEFLALVNLSPTLCPKGHARPSFTDVIITSWRRSSVGHSPQRTGVSDRLKAKAPPSKIQTVTGHTSEMGYKIHTSSDKRCTGTASPRCACAGGTADSSSTAQKNDKITTVTSVRTSIAR
ncbi:hypothetical protein EVAR_30416_1 [Eumeta japonica]|uniref:Uncharacterized protein n=1 Tax=Eumeta variegata TaxID=151549 RepID=A0A4C1W817_EUMVA|nr:hypothetical protein EVAR_30416_1 [Eumeta japonica]